MRETQGSDAAGLAFRAPVAPNPRGQEGSILLLVITIVLVLSLAVVGLLNYSLNTDSTAVTVEVATKSLYSIDGAMEEAVNAIRNDPSACVSAATPYGDYEVSCVIHASESSPARRTLNLIATKSGSSTSVAQARIRVVDEVNGQALIGYSIEVCDWLLGQSVTEPMQGCAAPPVTP